MAAFVPARSLYASAGFRPCGPFADYPATSYSSFMTIRLDSPDAPPRLDDRSGPGRDDASA
jgi:putative acetyltransferase